MQIKDAGTRGGATYVHTCILLFFPLSNQKYLVKSWYVRIQIFHINMENTKQMQINTDLMKVTVLSLSVSLFLSLLLSFSPIFWFPISVPASVSCCLFAKILILASFVGYLAEASASTTSAELQGTVCVSAVPLQPPSVHSRTEQLRKTINKKQNTDRQAVSTSASHPAEKDTCQSGGDDWGGEGRQQPAILDSRRKRSSYNIKAEREEGGREQRSLTVAKNRWWGWQRMWSKDSYRRANVCLPGAEHERDSWWIPN